MLSEYLFSNAGKRNYINKVNKWTDNIKITRNQFIKYFGNSNPNKNNRYSWSICPKYNIWNNGQILTILNNNIMIYYCYKKDTRNRKIKFPKYLKKKIILITIWKFEKLKRHIEDKFNNKGFFICKKINNIYKNILFGKTFDFKYFIKGIKNRSVFFDSGLYEGNKRNYSLFRGKTNEFWNKLIINKY